MKLEGSIEEACKIYTMNYPSIILLFFISLNFPFQNDWQFKKEVDGIKVYTKETSDLKYDSYKVEAIINTSIQTCAAVIQDNSAFLSLYDDTKTADVHLQEGDTHIVFYVRTGLPFPVRDRDAYYDNYFSYDEDKKAIMVEFTCLKGLDRNKRIVRIENCKGLWSFQDIGNGQVLVRHEFQADPGGLIPAWLVNKKTIDSPIKSIQALKLLVTKEQYQDSEFSFIQD